MNYTRRLVRGMRHGEKGFTLIELLVVIAILGVIAAVVLLNVGGFMGSGAKESANTEAHQVQTGAIAYMVYHSTTALASGTVVGPNAGGDGQDIIDAFLLGGPLQADYTINTKGEITDATADADGKWKDLTWSAAAGWHE